MSVIVITGNPVEGLFFYGPFEDARLADLFIQSQCDGDNAWIAPVVSELEYEAQQLEIFTRVADDGAARVDSCRHGSLDPQFRAWIAFAIVAVIFVGSLVYMFWPRS